VNSLIERANQRLEQLRNAGVMPETDATVRSDAPPTQVSTAQSQLVELDPAVLESAGVLTPNSPRSLIADQFRIVKRPLLERAFGSGTAKPARANLVMVTSAMPGEGKSYTAINLAMSVAAELDHSVMLVDADVARPSVPRMLGLQEGPGLLEVLRGKSVVSDVLLRTNVEGLTVLRSGSAHAHATELIASEAMRVLLDDLATRYPERLVIFDSPPLLLTTEARVLASHMGQILVVVQAEKTLQSEVQAALAAIEDCPVKMMVLNKVRVESGGAYGYGYGYGYGLGYGR
jgi:exopolysaccharide/PEP-CTERM locus tyrosine autokinase